MNAETIQELAEAVAILSKSTELTSSDRKLVALITAVIVTRLGPTLLGIEKQLGEINAKLEKHSTSPPNTTT